MRILVDPPGLLLEVAFKDGEVLEPPKALNPAIDLLLRGLVLGGFTSLDELLAGRVELLLKEGGLAGLECLFALGRFKDEVGGLPRRNGSTRTGACWRWRSSSTDIEPSVLPSSTKITSEGCPIRSITPAILSIRGRRLGSSL